MGRAFGGYLSASWKGKMCVRNMWCFCSGLRAGFGNYTLQCENPVWHNKKHTSVLPPTRIPDTEPTLPRPTVFHRGCICFSSTRNQSTRKTPSPWALLPFCSSSCLSLIALPLHMCIYTCRHIDMSSRLSQLCSSNTFSKIKPCLLSTLLNSSKDHLWWGRIERQ